MTDVSLLVGGFERCPKVLPYLKPSDSKLLVTSQKKKLASKLYTLHQSLQKRKKGERMIEFGGQVSDKHIKFIFFFLLSFILEPRIWEN